MQALQEEMIVVLLDLLLYKAWLSELLLGDTTFYMPSPPKWLVSILEMERNPESVCNLPKVR